MALLVRITPILDPTPFPAPDSEVYLQAAANIAEGTASASSPPEGLYPGILALVDRSPEIMVLVQHGMGIVTSVLCFLLVLAWTRSRLWSMAAGLVCGTALNTIAYEHMLLTESTAALLLTAAALVLVTTVSRKGEHRSGPACAFSGVLFGASVLLRPVTALVSFVLLPALALRVPRKRWLPCAGLFLATLAVTLVVWVLAVSGGRFPAGYPGLNMTNQTGAFLEDAPDRYAAVRDVFVTIRDSSGTHRMVIWSAIPEMMRVTGLSYRELDRLALRMCLSAAAANPLSYAGEVLASLAGTWKGSPLPRDGEEPAGGLCTDVIWPVQSILLLALRGLFLIVVLSMVLRGSRGALSGATLLPSVMLAVVAVSVGTALLESANPRYLLPFQPILIAAAASAVVRLRKPLTVRAKADPKSVSDR